MKKEKLCYNCGHDIYKITAFLGEKVIKKKIEGNTVIICNHCGAYNSP